MRVSIRGGSGLGDALYVQAVARFMVSRGDMVEVCCDWPDVFGQYSDDVLVVSPFRRMGVSVVAHYSTRRGCSNTTQFEDCCISASIPRTAPLRLDWEPRASCERLRPFVLVAMAREPFARGDNYGIELLPDCNAVQRVIDIVRRDYDVVQVGKGESLHAYSGLSEDLSNRQSVSELIDLASRASGMIGQMSYMIPLAESLGKPGLFVWSRRGLSSKNEVLSRLTPRKVLHHTNSLCVVDDCTDEHMRDVADVFCREAGRREAA